METGHTNSDWRTVGGKADFVQVITLEAIGIDRKYSHRMFGMQSEF